MLNNYSICFYNEIRYQNKLSKYLKYTMINCDLIKYSDAKTKINLDQPVKNLLFDRMGPAVYN